MPFLRGCGRDIESENIREFIHSRCPDDPKRCQKQAVAAALSHSRKLGCRKNNPTDATPHGITLPRFLRIG